MEYIDHKQDCETQIVFKQFGQKFIRVKIKDTYDTIYKL